jgi:HEAT repeat protein
MVDQNVLESWISTLDNADSQVRQSAVENLLEAGAEAVEPLIITMQNQKGRKAWQAAEILSQIDDPRWVQPMKEMLTASNTVVATAAANALEPFGACVVDAFVEALPNCGRMAQMHMVVILERIGDERCVLPLMTLLQTTNSSDMQHTIIHALGLLGDRRAIELIRPFQNHENHHVSKRARNALRRLEESTTISSEYDAGG